MAGKEAMDSERLHDDLKAKTPQQLGDEAINITRQMNALRARREAVRVEYQTKMSAKREAEKAGRAKK